MDRISREESCSRKAAQLSQLNHLIHAIGQISQSSASSHYQTFSHSQVRVGGGRPAAKANLVGRVADTFLREDLNVELPVPLAPSVGSPIAALPPGEALVETFSEELLELQQRLLANILA